MHDRVSYRYTTYQHRAQAKTSRKSDNRCQRQDYGHIRIYLNGGATMDTTHAYWINTPSTSTQTPFSISLQGLPKLRLHQGRGTPSSEPVLLMATFGPSFIYIYSVLSIDCFATDLTTPLWVLIQQIHVIQQKITSKPTLLTAGCSSNAFRIP
jgi:hypothetical protein